MEKFYVLATNKATVHKTYEEAELAAKKKVVCRTDKYGREIDSADNVYICEAIAVASAPVPDVEVRKI